MPSLNDVLAGSQAQAVQVQQIIDALKGTPNKGVPVALVSLNDSNNYALTVQNDDPINSRALSVLKADGTTLISADATGVTLGAPINVPAGSLNGTQLANASVTNAKLASDTARANLLTNPGFEQWQRGAGPFTVTATYSADRWAISLIGTDALSVSRNTANVDSASQYCAACTFTLGSGAGSTSLQQLVRASDGFVLGARTITLSVRVRTSTANAVRIAIFDNTNSAQSTSSFHTGGGSYETLSATYAVPANCVNLTVLVYFATSCTAYIDNAMLVVGSQYADYAPPHPADDLARCERYYERHDFSQFYPIGQAQGSGTTNVQGPLVSLSTKAATPTITSVGTFGLQVGNGGLITVTLSPNATIKHVTLGGTATVTNGTVYTFQGTAAANAIIAEANP